MPKDRVPVSPVGRAGRALPGEEGGNRGMTPHGCRRSWRWLHVEYSDAAASVLRDSLKGRGSCVQPPFEQSPRSKSKVLTWLPSMAENPWESASTLVEWFQLMLVDVTTFPSAGTGSPFPVQKGCIGSLEAVGTQEVDTVGLVVWCGTVTWEAQGPNGGPTEVPLLFNVEHWSPCKGCRKVPATTYIESTAEMSRQRGHPQ